MQKMMRRPLRAACFVVTIAVLAVSSGSALAARIGVLSNKYAVETAADFNTRVGGHIFTAVDTSNTIPSAATLASQFDALLLFEDGTSAQAPALGTAVAAYAHSGRAVILGTFYDQDRSDGSLEFTPHGWGELEHIDPNTTDGVGTSYATRTLGAATNHPIMSGVTALSANKFAGGNQAKPNTIVVAYWAQKNARGEPDPAVAYRITGRACVIHLAIAPNYPVIGVIGADFGGDFYRLWRNTFDFAGSGCITGTAQLGASDAIAIPASSPLALALAALLLAAVGGRRLARRRVR
jgi:hypothetical protein